MEIVSGEWTVHKFGGTSVGSATSMRECYNIIKDICHKGDRGATRVAVVVSAMGGKPKVTDLLLDLVHASAAGRLSEVDSKMQSIRDKHRICVHDILEKSPQSSERILALIDKDLRDIMDLLRADTSPPSKLPHLMITGYIATTLSGIATTLKRDGSDFSASIFGKLLRATAITIWTDVSGVYSADPRRVPDAQIISESSSAEKARTSIREAFFYELKQGMVSDITSMSNMPGVSGLFFSALGGASVNDATRALRAVHSAFWLSSMHISIGVMMSDECSGNKEPSDLAKFFDFVKTGSTTPHTIIIDASTSFDVASMHPIWLKNGAHVVTANKRALSNSLELYNSVTIGASLPIRTTLNDILCSGDAVHSIVGIMSVSSGMIITEMSDNGLTFTEALMKTYKQGLFEDDAFLDLCGLEAAHKLLILARELGVPMLLEEIDVEPLAT
eukprot:gene33744-43607_t